MVGIFKWYGSWKLYAVSENEDSAIEGLYNRFDHSGYSDPRHWWEVGKRNNSGAPRCFDIQPIEVI